MQTPAYQQADQGLRQAVAEMEATRRAELAAADRFTGTCYRAANWIEVGTTKGRGKLEKNHRRVPPSRASWFTPSNRTSAPS